tara:strand:+ start:382 stop:600 length:219 start_codon:yes stop_codon:yes gene_type:complete
MLRGDNMKLRARDEIILRLIEETEHAWDFMDDDNAMGAHGCEANHCCQGRIDVLKWILSINEIETREDEKDD